MNTKDEITTKNEIKEICLSISSNERVWKNQEALKLIRAEEKELKNLKNAMSTIEESKFFYLHKIIHWIIAFSVLATGFAVWIITDLVMMVIGGVIFSLLSIILRQRLCDYIVRIQISRLVEIERILNTQDSRSFIVHFEVENLHQPLLRDEYKIHLFILPSLYSISVSPVVLSTSLVIE